jgi:hypothetical protein
VSARLHLSWSPWSSHELARLKGMAAAGLTAKQAARELGRAECGVKCKAMRAGIRFPRKGWRQPGPGRPSEFEIFAAATARASAQLKEAIARTGA